MREKIIKKFDEKMSSRLKLAVFVFALIFASVIFWSSARAANLFEPNVNFYLNDKDGKNPISGKIIVSDTKDSVTIGVSPNSGQTIKKRDVEIWRDGTTKEKLTLTSGSRCAVEKDFSPTDGAERKCSFKLADLKAKERPTDQENAPIDYLIVVIMTNNYGEKSQITRELQLNPNSKNSQVIEFAKIDNLANDFVKKDADGSYKIGFEFYFSDNISRDENSVKCYLLQKTPNGDVELGEKFSRKSVAECARGEFDLRGLSDGYYYLKTILSADQNIQAISPDFKLDQKNPTADFDFLTSTIQNNLSISQANFADDFENNLSEIATGCYIRKFGENVNLFEMNDFANNCGVKNSLNLSAFAEGNYEFTGWAQDLAKNIGAKTKNFVIDRTAPTNLTLQIDLINWRKGKIFLKATNPSDALSGVDKTKNRPECLIYDFYDAAQPFSPEKSIYRANDCFLENGTEIDVAKMIADGKISQDSNALYFFANAYDNSGNQTLTEAKKILLDRTAPTIQGFQIQNLDSKNFLKKVNGESKIDLKNGEIFDKESENGEKFPVKSNGCALKYNENEIFSAENVAENCQNLVVNSYFANQNGNYQFLIWATDYFGNRQEFSQEFKIDTNRSETTSPLDEINSQKYATKNVKLSFAKNNSLSVKKNLQKTPIENQNLFFATTANLEKINREKTENDNSHENSSRDFSEPKNSDSPENKVENWAVLNLALLIISVLVGAIFALRKIFVKRIASGILIFLPAIISVVTFILTENWRAQMILVDNWTIFMAAILALQIGTILFVKKNSSKK